MTSRGTNMVEAVNQALAEEMERDERVVLIGEDLLIWGGPYGAAKGLAQRYPNRVFSTPISEGAFVGAAVGAAATGLRPVVEVMFSDFLGVCLEPLMNTGAKLSFLTQDTFTAPFVLRTTVGAAHSMGATHGQSLYAPLAHVPGLTVIAPSTPSDAKGLLKAAIRCGSPVVFLEPKALYFRPREAVEEGERSLRVLGRARIHRSGSDVTIVAISRAVHWALEAAERLSQYAGVAAEVVDPVTLAPLDRASILASVKKTRRLLVVDEANPVCSIGSEIIAQVAQHAHGDLIAAPRLYSAPNEPIPSAPSLERDYLPNAAGIVERVTEMVSG